MSDFFSTIRKSIYDPEFYRSLTARPFSYSVKYYLRFVLFTAVVSTIILSVILIPLARHFIAKVPTLLSDMYPDELVLTMTSGVLSTNVSEPFFIDPPIEFADALRSEGYHHLVVIDTGSEITPDRFQFYETLVLLSARHIAAVDKGEMRVTAFDPTKSFTVDEGAIDRIIGIFEKYRVWIIPVLVVLLFLGMIFIHILNLFSLLLWALLIMLFGRLKGEGNWSYGDSYRIGLHALTLPVLLDVTLISFGPGLGGVPFLSTIIILLVVWANFKEDKPVVPVQEELPLGKDLVDETSSDKEAEGKAAASLSPEEK